MCRIRIGTDGSGPLPELDRLRTAALNDGRSAVSQWRDGQSHRSNPFRNTSYAAGPGTVGAVAVRRCALWVSWGAECRTESGAEGAEPPHRYHQRQPLLRPTAEITVHSHGATALWWLVAVVAVRSVAVRCAQR